MKCILPIAILMLTGCQHPFSSTASGPFSPPDPLPALALTVPWTGEICNVPAPATIPEFFKTSDTYRRWLRIKDIERWSILLPEGRTLVVDAWGMANSASGLSPLMPYMHIYRQDGTLELAQLNEENANPEEWTLYAADGKTKVVYVVNRIHGIAGTPFIEYVDFYKDGNADHQFAIHTPGRVTYDWQLLDDHHAGKLLHPVGKEIGSRSTAADVSK